jgi:hypothetical protein
LYKRIPPQIDVGLVNHFPGPLFYFDFIGFLPGNQLVPAGVKFNTDHLRTRLFTRSFPFFYFAFSPFRLTISIFGLL